MQVIASDSSSSFSSVRYVYVSILMTHQFISKTACIIRILVNRSSISYSCLFSVYQGKIIFLSHHSFSFSLSPSLVLTDITTKKSIGRSFSLLSLFTTVCVTKKKVMSRKKEREITDSLL